MGSTVPSGTKPTPVPIERTFADFPIGLLLAYTIPLSLKSNGHRSCLILTDNRKLQTLATFRKVLISLKPRKSIHEFGGGFGFIG